MGPVITWRDKTRCLIDACAALPLPSGHRLWFRLALVDGYLYPHEAVFLFHIARSSPGEGVIVEIGSFLGRSTLCLAAGSGDRGSKVFAIDPHLYQTEEMLRRNLKRFGADKHVVMQVQESVKAAAHWEEPVRVVFVDGNHKEESVSADVEAWLRHLIPGGFLVLHDSTSLSGFPGPRAVANRLFRVGDSFDRVGTLASISWGRKRGGVSNWQPPQYGSKFFDNLLKMRKSFSRQGGSESI